MMIFFIIAGLISGLLICKLSIDECEGKEKILTALITPFLILSFINGFSLIAVFITSHLIGSLSYLRWVA